MKSSRRSCEASRSSTKNTTSVALSNVGADGQVRALVPWHAVFRACSDLDADLQVQLTGSGHDVLTGCGSEALHQGIGLGQTLESLHELGQITGVGDIDGHAHDGRHGVLHGDDVVSLIVVGDG